MHTLPLDWKPLLNRVGESAQLLEQLESLADQHQLSFAHYGVALLELGFTVPEAQELFRILRA